MDPLEVVLHEARAGVEAQVVQVDELRSRVGLLLGAASISLALLAATADDGVGDWGVAGLVLLAASVVLLVGILFPAKPWRFGVNARAMLDTLAEDASADEFVEMLIRQKRDDLESNRTRMLGLYKVFSAAAVLLGASAVLLVFDLMVRR